MTDLSNLDQNSDPFEAKFKTKCASCGDYINEGDLMIKTNDGDYVHEDCSDS